MEALLTSSKKEPSAAARCVALSSTGLWLYEELTSAHQRHPRVKEAINVLLVSLKVCHFKFQKILRIGAKKTENLVIICENSVDYMCISSCVFFFFVFLVAYCHVSIKR